MNFEGTPIENATVQIRRKNESAWLTLGSPANLNPWTAKIAGIFEMRGIGTVDGKSVETPVVEVEVRFPSISQIMSDPGVQSRALQEWNATLADCTEVPNQRREHAYWIMLDTGLNSYSAGQVIFGEWATPTTPGYVAIPCGWPKSSPAHMYSISPPERRSTPCNE